MRQTRFALIVMCGVFAGALVIGQSACSKAASPPAAPPPSAAVPVGSVKQVMKGIIDPSSAEIWNSVGTESGPQGLIDRSPKTDDEWAKIEYSAMALAEAANLLKMPGRVVAKPDEPSKPSNPDAPELTPAQIEEKINKDRAAWEKKADALQQTAVKAMAAAHAHDKDGVLNVGEEIDNACESCHLIYWYPDQKLPDVGAAPKS